MLKNRIVCALMAFLLLFGGLPCAADGPETPEVKVTGEVIEIKGNIPESEAGEAVTLLILKAEEKPEDLNGLEGETSGRIIHMDETTIGEDLSFRIQAILSPETESGKYKAVLGINSLPGLLVSEPFDFVQPQEIKDALKQINQIDLTKPEGQVELAAVISENELALGIPSADFKAEFFAEKQRYVAEQIKSTVYDTEDYVKALVVFQTLFADAMCKSLTELAEAPVQLDNCINTYRKWCGYDFSAYDALNSPAKKEDFFLSLKEKLFSDTKSFYQSVSLAIFFAEFNNSDKNTMRTLFHTYNTPELLHIDISIFSGIDEGILFKKLSEKKYYSRDALAAEIERIVKELKKGGSGSTGGGGSGTGNGGSMTYTPPTETPAPTQKPDGIETVFRDLGDVAWARESISALHEKGIIHANDQQLFRPNDFVTREEFVKMLAAAMELPLTESDCSFLDADNEAWYAPYLAAAVKAGFVQGKPDNRFGVGEPISRQDIAVFLYRAVPSLGNATEKNDFADGDKSAGYAREAIGKLTGSGILNGYEDHTFRPHNNATRAETACILFRMITK